MQFNQLHLNWRMAFGAAKNKELERNGFYRSGMTFSRSLMVTDGSSLD